MAARPVGRPRTGEPVQEKRLEIARVPFAHQLGPRELVAQRGGHLGGRRSDADRVPIERDRAARVAQRGQVIGLEDERAEILRLELERLVERGVDPGGVAQVPARVREPDVARRIGGAGTDDSLERCAGRAGIASTERIGPGLREGVRIGRWQDHG